MSETDKKDFVILTSLFKTSYEHNLYDMLKTVNVLLNKPLEKQDYSVEINITKRHLNELVYVMQYELDAIKASLDGILEDMEIIRIGTND